MVGEHQTDHKRGEKMKLGNYVLKAVKELNEQGIFSGKTNIQKLIYFALPEEQKKSLYFPYHYGPYCGEVQQVVNALLKNRILKHDSSGLAMEKDLEEMLYDDAVFDRIHEAANFLSSRQVTQTEDIALMAKIRLLSKTEREDVKNDLSGYIKSQARFLGWMGLAEIDKNEIEKYLDLAESLDAALDMSMRTADTVV
jgi:uncharacterized protein YwgA